MKKVLHVTNAYPTPEYPIKGIFIKEQIDSLKASGKIHDVYFIDRATFGILIYFKSVFTLFRIKSSYDIIHSHHVFSALVCIASGTRRKLVTSFLSDGPQEVMIGPSWFRKTLFNLAYHCSSQRIFKSPRKALKTDRDSFIQNGVDSVFFAPVEIDLAFKYLNLNPTYRYVLFVSGQNLYRPEKRYDLFLAVIEKVNEILRMLGFASVKPLGISDADRLQMRAYYSVASCYILTSDFEGSPNAVKEALCCGTPVVSRAVGAVESLLSGIPNCYVVTDADVDMLAECVIKALNSESRFAIRSAFLEKNLSIESVVREIDEVYGRLLENTQSN